MMPTIPVRSRSALVAAVLLAATVAARLAAAESAAPAKQAEKGPLKVFILAGQSNMEGQAVADLDGKHYNDGKGTLARLMQDPAKAPMFKHLKDDKGQWTVRDDVWVWYKPDSGPVKSGPLTLGFTPYGGRHHFGPELQFGHVIGNCLPNQVLLLKTAWGGKSLYRDFRPPSSGGETGPYYKKMLADVREALANLKTYFPGYDGGGDGMGTDWTVTKVGSRGDTDTVAIQAAAGKLKGWFLDCAAEEENLTADGKTYTVRRLVLSEKPRQIQAFSRYVVAP